MGNHIPLRDLKQYHMVMLLEFCLSTSGRDISYVSISEDDARKAILGMGMSDWHTNILLELLKLSRGGYLSRISQHVEEITGKKPIPFSPALKMVFS